MIDIGVAGASGRMGREVIKALHNSTHMRLSVALVSANNDCLGIDAGELAGVGSNGILCSHQYTSQHTQPCDLFIDFSTVDASMALLPTLLVQHTPVVLCTTGFNSQQMQAIEQASRSIPLLQASNTSLGITLLLQLVKHAASRVLDADIEIIEAHHRNKVDAPSGTAITIGETIADARSETLEDAIYQRHGMTGVRPRGPVGFSTIRAGDIVGDHTVLLALDQEHIKISHHAESRALFAKGALSAARWLVRQQAGRVYSMENVLDGMADPS